MPYDPLILEHILGAHFLLIWGGGGVVKAVLTRTLPPVRSVNYQKKEPRVHNL